MVYTKQQGFFLNYRDVSFKLHAAYNTVVEGERHNGNLVSLKMTPNSRTGDVVNIMINKRLVIGCDLCNIKNKLNGQI